LEATATLAHFITKTRPADIPDAIRHEAKRALVNIAGCAVGSGGHETVERAVAALQLCFGRGEATLAGRSERCDVQNAALINGIAAHVLDFDDTHPHTIHPSAPVWPALWALAEARRLSGRELLDAFAIGAEVELRIGNAVYPSHGQAGFHPTGTCGVFGSAAACARALQLDSERTRWALGLATAQSTGLREMFGSDCKSLHAGRAARDGMIAALLAEKYFESSDRAIEAPHGFANVLATARDIDAIGAGLGAHWEFSANMYKPFACGLVVHAAIDACIQLRDEHALDPSRIVGVSARVNPLVLELTAKTEPRSGLEGKFSVYHACAIAILRGRASESEFGDAAVLDPQTVDLRRKVEALADPGVAMMEAHVTIRLDDGSSIRKHVANALGSRERPMSDRDLGSKFLGLVAEVLAPDRASALLEACWNADRLDTARTISRLLGRAT
jgi:2-methylcitrate dehydratase PrpD